jgi:hypothetical protein
MTRYTGGSEVRGGYYLSLDRWHIATISGDRGVLEGAGEERFIMLALPAVLVVAAAISIAYAMFLPFIGFAMVTKVLGAKLFNLGRGVVRSAIGRA